MKRFNPDQATRVRELFDPKPDDLHEVHLLEDEGQLDRYPNGTLILDSEQVEAHRNPPKKWDRALKKLTR